MFVFFLFCRHLGPPRGLLIRHWYAAAFERRRRSASVEQTRRRFVSRFLFSFTADNENTKNQKNKKKKGTKNKKRRGRLCDCGPRTTHTSEPVISAQHENNGTLSLTTRSLQLASTYKYTGIFFLFLLFQAHFLNIHSLYCVPSFFGFVFFFSFLLFSCTLLSNLVCIASQRSRRHWNYRRRRHLKGDWHRIGDSFRASNEKKKGNQRKTRTTKEPNSVF